LTEPWGVTVDYTSDKVGRLTTVAPSSTFGGVSNFASNAQYRAWGALKHLEYANGVNMNTTFDNRLQPDTFQLGTTSTTVMNKSYDYYSDGKLKFVDDSVNGNFDRLNSYDHVGRIYKAKTGSEANGSSGGTIPYRQQYTFNAFDDMTARTNLFWNSQEDASYTFSNHRISGWSYDADGRVTASVYPDGPSIYEYNAAGQLIFKHDYPGSTETGYKYYQYYDGNGQILKRGTDRCLILVPPEPEPPPEECSWYSGHPSPLYFIRSTVLGGEVIAETQGAGVKYRRFVYAGGAKVAELTERFVWPSSTYDSAQFHHTDANGVSERVTRNSPETLLGTTTSEPNYIDPRHSEFDAAGGNTGLVSNFQPIYLPGEPPIGLEDDSNYINGQIVTASWNGIRIPMQAARNLINTGSIGGSMGLNEKLLRQMSAAFTNIWGRGVDSTRSRYFGDDISAAQSWATSMTDRGYDVDLHLSINLSSSMNSFFDFSWLPRSQRQTGGFDVKQIKENIAKLYGNKRCKDFLDKLFSLVSTKKNYVEEGGDMNKLFADLLSMKKGGLTRVSPNGARLGTVVGRIKDNNQTIYVARNKTAVTETDTMAIFHEMIHGAGHRENYTDRALAEAVYKNFSEIKPLLNAKQVAWMENPTKEMKNDSGAYQWGGVWDTALDHYCFRNEKGESLLFVNPAKKTN
jgi:YD repeat-containing protein